MTNNKTLLLSLMVTTVLSFNLQAYEGTVSSSGQCGKNTGDCVYTIYTDGHMEITGTGAMNSYDTTSCYGKSCAASKKTKAPWGNVNVTSINITGITSIGGHAFTGVTSLQTVTMSDSVKSMGAQVFWQAKNLTSVTLSNDLETISTGTFSEAESLSNITIPSSVQKIESGAFSGTNIESLVIPKSDNTLAGFVGESCTNLKNVEFEDESQLTSIGTRAFFDTKITEIDLPDTLTSLGIVSMLNLTSLFIPENVTLKEDSTYGTYGAFAGMNKLEELYCPESIKLQCEENLAKYTALSESILKTYEAKGGVYALTDSSGNTTYFDSYASLKGGTVCEDTTACQATFMAADGTYCSTSDECSALITADKNGDVLISGGKRYASLADLYANNPMPSIEEVEQSDGSFKVYKDGVFIGYKNKRIYTVEEANALTKPTGNTVRIKYR